MPSEPAGSQLARSVSFAWNAASFARASASLPPPQVPVGSPDVERVRRDDRRRTVRGGREDGVRGVGDAHVAVVLVAVHQAGVLGGLQDRLDAVFGDRRRGEVRQGGARIDLDLRAGHDQRPVAEQGPERGGAERVLVRHEPALVRDAQDQVVRAGGVLDAGGPGSAGAAVRTRVGVPHAAARRGEHRHRRDRHTDPSHAHDRSFGRRIRPSSLGRRVWLGRGARPDGSAAPS